MVTPIHRNSQLARDSRRDQHLPTLRMQTDIALPESLRPRSGEPVGRFNRDRPVCSPVGAYRDPVLLERVSFRGGEGAFQGR